MIPAAFGLVKTTLLDYPGLVSAVVFVPGCNLRCPWCHNPGLVHAPWDHGLVPLAEVSGFLKKRRGVLQGVVFTGGEPFFHPDWESLAQEAKALGYSVKLDTNGTFPRRLAQLDRTLVDYLAVDVKNAPSRYAVSTGIPIAAAPIEQTLELMRTHWPGRSEVRLTWVPGLNRREDLAEFAAFVGPGLRLYVQAYRPGKVLDPLFAGARAPTDAEIDAVVGTLVDLGLDAHKR